MAAKTAGASMNASTMHPSRMTPLLKQLEEQARTLSPEDRARLAESMLESLQPSIPEIDCAWAEEIERRVDAVDRGLMPTHSAADVFAEAKTILP
jgi:putative addiction module component (TIGR02574 family)